MTLTWTNSKGKHTATGAAGEFIAWPLRSSDKWAVKLVDREWLRVADDVDEAKVFAQGREDAACRPRRVA